MSVADSILLRGVLPVIVAHEEGHAVQGDEDEGDLLFGDAAGPRQQEGNVEERQGDAGPEAGGGERAREQGRSERRPVCGGWGVVTGGV